MARKNRDTGEGDPYTPAEAGELADALAGAYEAWDSDEEPGTIDVTAQIEWAGEIATGNDGVRRTRLDVRHRQQAMRKVREAVDKARRARPAKSRDAKGWHAQLRELTEAKRGSEAADRAGLNPTARTLQRWLSDPDYPVRSGDRERIAKAYDELRNFSVRDAQKAVADAMTEALREEYGQNVRMRKIDRLEFE